ncbi:MAG: signal peptidase II [Alphaproteobacteria bacterium]|nr:signal peptidase II [Alphaproteobacteria bacterium]
MNFPSYKLIAVVLAVIVAATDQFTKNAILDLFPKEGMSQAVTSFFNLVLVYNHGISFGMFNHAPVETQPLIFIAVAATITTALIIWLLRTRSRLIVNALGMIIGGAIGNGIDRALHGAVIDFIDFYVTWGATPHHWPSFNVADSAIVCGVGLLFIDSLAFDKKNPQE